MNNAISGILMPVSDIYDGINVTIYSFAKEEKFLARHNYSRPVGDLKSEKRKNIPTIITNSDMKYTY